MALEGPGLHITIAIAIGTKLHWKWDPNHGAIGVKSGAALHPHTMLTCTYAVRGNKAYGVAS